MRVLATFFVTLLSAGAVDARTDHGRREIRRSFPHIQPRDFAGPGLVERAEPIIKANNKTEKFKVNGKGIPEVDFDIGESYAGLLPISDEPDAAELYFWFFPSANPKADDEILIWLNGGPGCSSLEGLLQETGPFLWQYGTFRPVKNQYSWTNLTNVVFVEFPAGVGFSQQNKSPVVQTEEEAAAQFLGFWRNFIDAFDLHKRRVFITGESYAAYYVSYITDAMHNATEKNSSDLSYFNAEGSLIFDGDLWYDVVLTNIPAVSYVDKWSAIFNLNSTFTADIHSRADKCNYTTFLSTALQYPPHGPLPPAPNFNEDSNECGLYTDILAAATLTNPCFNVYNIRTTCPISWDVLGYPGTIFYTPPGSQIYFNRADVKTAINAPLHTPWSECNSKILDKDPSMDPPQAVLPRIIGKNKKTVLGHGDLDFRYINTGNLVAVQNMTWGGGQGLSRAPEEWRELYVPYHSELGVGNLGGAGVMGRWTEERGLTYVHYSLSGHMIPQYVPGSAFRTIEYLLGRIESLDLVGDFTTQQGDFGNGGK